MAILVAVPSHLEEVLREQIAEGQPRTNREEDSCYCGGNIQYGRGTSKSVDCDKSLGIKHTVTIQIN